MPTYACRFVQLEYNSATMSTHELVAGDPSETAILNRLMLDVRGDYEPPLDYHGWEGHILTGLKRIDELQASGIATDVNNWFIVRFGYICHDRFLSQIKLGLMSMDGYECAEQVAADHSRALALEYGLDEEIADEIHYSIMATNPRYPCETPEARATCRVDLGNTGDGFDEFFRNFVLVQIEEKRIDQILLNPLSVVRASCDFLALYMRRSTLSLGPEDDFANRVENNLAKLRLMGASAIRAAFFRQLSSTN